ncbi:hypothetical protein JVU11DRAFT_3755 [Chiua virens]|nr:hypothetical protein JVU11DRAFT_3755 [Chiua virens]
MGYFPIEIVQFRRGGLECRGPLHWAIIVRTSEHRGNRHDLIGDTYTYTVRNRFNIPLDLCEDWRGGHVVGFVRPDKIDRLLERITSVPVRRQQPTWSDQNWVWEVLYRLNYDYLYTDERMLFTALQTQMCRLLEAWELGEI